jgi:hypothetical protein
MKTIILKDFWEILVSRKQGKEVFAIAEKELFKVEFDFTDIRLTTSSFADELFAKWFMKFWKVFKIINLKDNFTKNMIKQVIVGRKQLV